MSKSVVVVIASNMSTHLAGPGFGVLLLDLDFYYVAWMLNDLRNIGFVPAAHLAGNAFGQIYEASSHPILPKYSYTGTKRRKVCFNHAERSVDGPENEENNKQVVSVPEAFEVCATGLLDGSEHNGHQC